jgi:lipoprotein-releasing system ATP-binding protein
MILTANNICKTYPSPTPVQVLKGVDLNVEHGEAVAIMGKSGEGKSTLLHILGTLEKPCAGQIRICDLDVDAGLVCLLRNRHIGFVFQFCHLLNDETLIDNILMPARIARIPTHRKSPAYERALKLLEAVGLIERAHFLAKLLSGGEKQKAAVARALCNDPELILADEPSGNLDHAQSQALHALLIRLTKDQGKSLIVVTHDQELAALCDRTLLLKEGHLWTY